MLSLVIGCGRGANFPLASLSPSTVVLRSFSADANRGRSRPPCSTQHPQLRATSERLRFYPSMATNSSKPAPPRVAASTEGRPVVAPSTPRAAITHVIFDMDGLLLDTEDFYSLVQQRILERYGRAFDWSLKAKMMGKKAIEAARVFVEEMGIADQLSAEDFLVEREEMLKELFPTSELMPGAERLIRHLHTSGIPICIATGSHQKHFELKTQKHRELISLMHHVVKGDDLEVKHGKPSPDVFLVAAKRFQGDVDARKTLVFEDAPAGVAAAKNAGMWVVMVPDSRLDASYLDDADQVLDSLLNFEPDSWGLPPFLV